uniref:Uncharacterized protein n=1 Tax=Hucho hucho TaxID=62062 RepID=A0A4W5QGH9_9TELE
MDVLLRAVMCFCLMGWMTLGWSNAAQLTSNTMKSNIDKLKVHYTDRQLPNGRPTVGQNREISFLMGGQQPKKGGGVAIYVKGTLRRPNLSMTRFPSKTLVRNCVTSQNAYFYTSDTTVQEKALSELFTIYEKASKLGHLKKDNRRKRRQAQRLKSHIM